jgi:hypothetical protein
LRRLEERKRTCCADEKARPAYSDEEGEDEVASWGGSSAEKGGRADDVVDGGRGVVVLVEGESECENVKEDGERLKKDGARLQVRFFSHLGLHRKRVRRQTSKDLKKRHHSSLGFSCGRPATRLRQISYDSFWS